MKSPLLGLQKAIFERLTQRLTTIPVYDEVPMDATCPYVTLGEDTAIDGSTKLVPGQDITTTLHLWSEYPGATEVKQMIDDVIRCFTVAPLDMTAEGFEVAVMALELNQVLRESDGEKTTRHGVLRFRFKVYEIPEVE